MKTWFFSMQKVNNVPTDVDFNQYPYIVAKVTSGKLWFWGAFETMEDAAECSKELDNAVVLLN